MCNPHSSRVRQLGVVEGAVALPKRVTFVLGVVGLTGFPVGLETEVRQLSKALQSGRSSLESYNIL